MTSKEPSCTIECKDMGYDCAWYCNADDEDEAIHKAKAHAAQAHNVKNVDEKEIRGKVKVLRPDLGCDEEAEDRGEEDPGCAISG